MSFIPFEPSSHANVLGIQASDRELLRTHAAFYRHIMFGPGPLSRRERELVAVTVSVANHCHY